MDLDLRLVRYFVAVADELHFGRAAARLYVSQPALSKQIRKLESQLGEPLLVRDSRHVTLTARGERFYEDARELLAMAERLQRPVRPEGSGWRTSSSSRPAATCATPSPDSFPASADARARHGQQRSADGAPGEPAGRRASSG